MIKKRQISKKTKENVFFFTIYSIWLMSLFSIIVYWQDTKNHHVGYYFLLLWVFSLPLFFYLLSVWEKMVESRIINEQIDKMLEETIDRIVKTEIEIKDQRNKKARESLTVINKLRQIRLHRNQKIKIKYE